MESHDDRELPDGNVTFLFTDIEGSTRLMVADPVRYEAVLDLHHDLLRGVWRRHDGAEVNTEGDAFFVAFGSADHAVRAAADAQRTLAAAEWPGGADPRVRMGLHTGFARPRHGDYSALAVNRAARIVGAAQGGQILLSQDTREALRDAEDELTITAIGTFRVRDFDQPTLLHRVVADGWVDQGRAPRLRPADGHNLVRPLTTFVDRLEERAALAEALGPGRLVSVVGPGGVGKTRLVVEGSLEVVDRWRDGVWFVDLEPVQSDEHLANAIAEAVGAAQAPGRPSVDDVRLHLETRNLLLVLDNAERLAEPVAHLASSLLQACEELGILVTSRRPLGLRAEQVLRLGALASDASDDPAVELFLDRAAGVDADELPAVRELCRQLEGLPLAIELAAARSRAVRPTQVLEAMRESPSLLSSQDPTLPERHRSLERLLDNSRELLDDAAQLVLRRLTVFDGSFDLRLARAACDHGDAASADVVEGLWSLTDHALVVADETAGASRYRLPHMVRSYAAALQSRAEAVRTATSLGTLYLARLGPLEATNRSWLSEMAAEMDNVRGVIRDLADVEPDIALELAWSIGRFHVMTTAYATGIDEAARHVALLQARSPGRVGLLTLLADLHLRTGDVGAGLAVLDEAEELEGEVGPAPWDESGVTRARGEMALRSGHLDEAEQWARRALDRSTSDRSRIRAWSLLGIIQGASGNMEAAIDSFEQDLAAARRGGMETFMATTHGNLAETHLRRGDRVEAARQQLACLDLSRAHGETSLIAYSVMIAARMAAEDNDFALAVTLDRAGRAALAAANHDLYENDRTVSEALREQARHELGDAAFDRALVRGEELALAEAAAEAEQVLNDARHGNHAGTTTKGRSWQGQGDLGSR